MRWYNLCVAPPFSECVVCALDPVRRGGVLFCARCTNAFCITPGIFETRSSNCTILLLPDVLLGTAQNVAHAPTTCIRAPGSV